MTAPNSIIDKNRSARRHAFPILFLLSAIAAGCGGGFTTGATWDPKEGRLFDDGIDVMGDISKLSGKWEYDALDELDARANLADTVAVIEVLAVQTNKDIDGAESRKLDTRVARVIYGTTPSNDLALLSTPESLGWALILRHEARLVGRHIAFLRWFTGADGKPANHFHLSPSSPALESAVFGLVEKRKAEEEAMQNTR